MKRITKLLLAVFAVVLLVGAISLQVFAADSGDTAPARKSGTVNAYRIIAEDGSLVGEYTPGASATNALSSALATATNGQTIQLLGDMKMTATSTLGYGGGEELFIDLNGYNLSNSADQTKGNPYLMSIGTNGTSLTFYSSDKNYESGIFQSSSAGTNVTGQAFVYLHANDCTVRFGTPVKDSSGSITGYTDANLAVFANNIVNLKFASASQKCTGSRIELYGGKYVRSIHSVHPALLQINGEASLYAEGAEFYSYVDYVFGNSGGLADANYMKTASASFKDCFFYSTSALFDVIEAMAPRVAFDNCEFVSGKIGTNQNLMKFQNCISTSELNSNDYRVNITKDKTLFSNVYSYSSGVINESSFNIIKSTTTVQYLHASEATEYANITWINGEKQITDKWVIGSIPIPPVGVYPSTDVYRYEISPEIHVVNESDVKNGVTYVVTPNINFNVKANISLFSNFIYKVYLPKEYVDNGSINWARINNKTVSPSFAIDIDGVDHYAYEYEISAVNGIEEFTFEIEVDGYNETFTKTYTFSIPKYAQLVENNNYTEDAKALVGATITYIKAALNCLDTTGDLPYPPASNPDLSALPDADSKAPMKTSEAFTNVFYSAGLNLDGKIQVRFEIKNVSDAQKAVTFEYRQGADSAYAKKTLTSEDWTATTLGNGEAGYYYDLTLAARDLRDNIHIYLAGNDTTKEDYIFCLANYVYGLNATGTRKTLLDALFAYSKAADNYIHEQDGVSTPIITIGNAVVSSENYVIVAPNANYEPALKLQAAIKKLTGETVTVISANDTTTKNKIYLNVTTPLPEQDFLATVDGNDLVLLSFKSFMGEACDLFISKYLSSRTNKTFDRGFVNIQFTDKIYYSDFGAVSHRKPTVSANYSDNTNYGRNQGSFDTSADDSAYDKALRESNFKAISKTHEFANSTRRHTVYADAENPNPIYWIKEAYFDNAVRTINIKTNVNWEGVHFIIDNSCLNPIKENNVDYKSTYNANIFTIAPDNATLTFSQSELAKLQSSVGKSSSYLNLNLGYDALVVIKYDGHRIFRRKGYYTGALGSIQNELIVIDKYGKISEETPLMWDYPSITSADVYKIDTEPTLVQGGKFTTIASQKNLIHTTYKYEYAKDLNGNLLRDDDGNLIYKCEQDAEGNIILDDDGKPKYIYATDSEGNIIYDLNGKPIHAFTETENTAGSLYFSRGLQVSRSNTTVLGVEHYTENEFSFEDRASGNTILKCGTAQSGFFHADYASHVTFKNCVLTGQKCYKRPEGGTTGTYDFGAGYTNKIVLDGCIQSNFFVTVDENGETTAVTETTEGAIPSMNAYVSSSGHDWLMHWGIGGTNYCKNMEYLNSTLSRFDAHMGLYNGKIENSTVQVIALTGMGDMEISNTRLFVLTPAKTVSLATYNNLIHLRNDYGCTWDGEITATNVDIIGYTDFDLVMYSYTNWDYGYTTAFPSLAIENINLYYADSKQIINGEAVYTEFDKTETVEISNHGFKDTIHLDTVTLNDNRPWRQYTDYNGDGVVDTVFDFNQNGIIDEDDTVYSSILQSETYHNGVKDTSSYENLNIVKPPKYIYVSDADLAKYNFELLRDNPFFANTSHTVIKPTKIVVNPFDLPVVSFK